MVIDFTAKVGQIRALINDVDETAGLVFSDDELQVFLDLEGDSVKLAAAQALDVIADDEVLTGKVIRDSDGKSTDGAKVADSLRKRATSLRQQAADADEGYFEILPTNGPVDGIELTGTSWWP